LKEFVFDDVIDFDGTAAPAISKNVGQQRFRFAAELSPEAQCAD
jgi:hypothetical protein